MNPVFHRPFKAIRTEYNGRMYDSKGEAEHAMQLDLLVRAGKVAWWIPQVTIPLGPDHTFKVDFLVAEFATPYVAGRRAIYVVAEDFKGCETREFARHKRMWAKYGPFPLKVVSKRSSYTIEPGAA